MWEWFDNDVLRENWIADMNEMNHFRLVNNSPTNLSLSMYKGRRSEGCPVCFCDRPCILLAPSIGNPGASRFYYVCASYYEPNGEKCCMKLLYGEKKEPNWSAILEEVSVLRMEILELKEKKKKRP
ncbi:hypothetical protein ACFE04_019491 [Oxalis oulophora]